MAIEDMEGHMKFAKSVGIAALVCLGLTVAVPALEDRVLEFPANYKTEFDNYIISDRLGNEDQVISLYANDVARAAARKGEKLPDGSILVGELYKAKKDADGTVIESALGRRIPETLAAIVVMERRAAWADQYPDDLKLGGWEFEVFSPDGKNLGKDTTACRECHAPLGETDFTWSIHHMAGGN